VMDGAYNPNHPGALAHLDPPPLAASIAAELVCAGLNNNLLAEELSPSLTRLERSLCTWLAEAIGLPPGSGGVPASGGSLSNLMALVTARVSRGLQQRGDLVLLASADAHVSLRKALMVMGLPPQALVAVPVDGEGRLQLPQLEAQLQDLRRQGRPVLAVVATAGTTVCGAVDPLLEISRLCRSHGVWLHVDGAIGGVYALDTHHADRVQGLGLADSVTVNPQKLLGITKTSSLLLLAEPGQLQAAFGTGLPYMEASWGGGHGGECGIQGTRPAEVLKLWLGLRQLGHEGIKAILDGAVARQQALAGRLEAVPGLQLRRGELHLLAMTPHGLSPEQADVWSLRTRQQLLEAQLMLSRPLYQGRHHLKAVLGNPHTGEAQLQQLAAIVAGSVEAPP
ncbi:MAG: aminotransferase class V-fold PLP-dependent enzyme, partial [Cyanobacteriota bacterium]|nr:aminotransferase class V-fold PLP-dependent enzyme [Cyanobacteriota bacterium]